MLHLLECALANMQIPAGGLSIRVFRSRPSPAATTIAAHHGAQSRQGFLRTRGVALGFAAGCASVTVSISLELTRF